MFLMCTRVHENEKGARHAQAAHRRSQRFWGTMMTGEVHGHSCSLRCLEAGHHWDEVWQELEDERLEDVNWIHEWVGEEATPEMFRALKAADKYARSYHSNDTYAAGELLNQIGAIIVQFNDELKEAELEQAENESAHDECNCTECQKQSGVRQGMVRRYRIEGERPQSKNLERVTYVYDRHMEFYPVAVWDVNTGWLGTTETGEVHMILEECMYVWDERS